MKCKKCGRRLNYLFYRDTLENKSRTWIKTKYKYCKVCDRVICKGKKYF